MHSILVIQLNPKRVFTMLTKYVLLVLFSTIATISLGLFNQNSVSAKSSEAILFQETTTDFFVEPNTLDYSHGSFSLPFMSFTPSGEGDEKEEVNKKEWKEWEAFFSAAYFNTHQAIFSAHAIKQFQQIVANRTKLSLVILYHSWKRFLN